MLILSSSSTLTRILQASKKEREKAKRERKEARKLAATPVAPLTDDVQPREFLNEAERQETLEWISERKAHFPSRENLAKKREAAAALAKSGAAPPGHHLRERRYLACTPFPTHPSQRHASQWREIIASASAQAACVLW